LKKKQINELFYLMKQINRQKIIDSATKTIQIELDAMQYLLTQIDDNFADVVAMLLQSKGRIIVTGIGKSANVATKIVATLNSTGTPAIFMHASDAIHGDLGIVQENDVVLMLSKSGDTSEIKVIIPFIKNFGNKIIGLTANKNSYLAKNADFLLLTPLEREACPNNLAPTTSTTLQMVMGDALAVALLENRGFNDRDFAKYHPGGTLGKKLYLRVEDVISEHERPISTPNDLIKEVIIEITKKRLGATGIIDNDNKLIGIITDGDVRRMLQSNLDITQVKAQDVMTKKPKTIRQNAMAIDALKKMREGNISQLVVVDDNNIYVGMIHLHDLLKEGLI
jgi:arabinose-5-phosphate isomerase